MAGEEHHLLAVGELGADEFVASIEADGDDAGGARIGKFGELRFLYRAVFGGEENVTAGFLQIARGNDGRERFVFLEADDAVDGLAARGRGGFGNFVHLQPVHAALRGEQQNVTVRRGDEEVLDEIFVAGLRADAALAAARLMAVDVDRRALDVAGMADGDGHLFVFDQVFELDFLDAIDDLGAALVAIGFQDFAQLGDDDGFQFLVAGENFEFSSSMRSRISASSLRISSMESCVRRCNCSSRMASIWM